MFIAHEMTARSSLNCSMYLFHSCQSTLKFSPEIIFLKKICQERMNEIINYPTYFFIMFHFRTSLATTDIKSIIRHVFFCSFGAAQVFSRELKKGQIGHVKIWIVLCTCIWNSQWGLYRIKSQCEWLGNSRLKIAWAIGQYW